MFGKIAQDEIFAKQEELIDLAKKIWENPEMSFQEVKASQWIAEFLEKGLCSRARLCRRTHCASGGLGQW